MGSNLPVTQKEFPYPDGRTIVSVTDTKGRITYCNSTFVMMSGYRHEELIGQAHSIVRHPDMPAEAFRDLWATIEKGLPWTGVVKNRRKDGGHYWVRANATPMRNGDRIVGYLSVRTKPSREEVAACEALYAKMRAEAASGRIITGVDQGRIVRRDPLGRLLQALVPGERAWRLAVMLGTCGACVVAGAFLPAVAAAAVGLAAAAGAAWYARRTTDGVLDSLADDANRMAAGDLSRLPCVDHAGMVGRVQQALLQLALNLRTVIGDVRGEVAVLLGSVEEIAAGNQDLSARTESQASSLEETAASMEEMNSTIQSSAGAAVEGARLAAETADVAERSSASVRAVAGAMDQIQESSRRIAEIIRTIEGVAFQTNILALNAAVEAARAGEQGRGFSVVAAEVRALAQRTSTAAGEIRALITEAGQRVAAGGRQTSEAGARMQEALGAAGNVSRLLRDISSSASEQKSGVAQISEAVMNLDAITQQNAAMVEQLAAAAASLRGQVSAVSDTMNIFRLSEGDKGIAELDAVSLRREAKQASAQALGAQRAGELDVQKAVSAHLAWKARLRNAALGEDKVDPDAVRRDDACVLGEWLHGPGRSSCGDRPSFASLVEDHRRFHECAGAVADRIATGRCGEAQKMLEGGTPFAAATQKVVVSIRTLSTESGIAGASHPSARGSATSEAAARTPRRAQAAVAVADDWAEF